jgi:uncharacterized protein YndB with AHSA1/START domain
MEDPIHETARVDCTPADAFRHFVEPGRLEAWLTERARVEAKQGGRYELFWDPENPERDSTIGCRITVYEPDKLLAFDWKGPTQFADFMNATDPLTHVTVSFHRGDVSTNVHLVHTGWRSSSDWQEAREYFSRAWKHALAELEAQVNGPVKAQDT